MGCGAGARRTGCAAAARGSGCRHERTAVNAKVAIQHPTAGTDVCVFAYAWCRSTGTHYIERYSPAPAVSKGAGAARDTNSSTSVRYLYSSGA